MNKTALKYTDQTWTTLCWKKIKSRLESYTILTTHSEHEPYRTEKHKSAIQRTVLTHIELTWTTLCWNTQRRYCMKHHVPENTLQTWATLYWKTQSRHEQICTERYKAVYEQHCMPTKQTWTTAFWKYIANTNHIMLKNTKRSWTTLYWNRQSSHGPSCTETLIAHMNHIIEENTLCWNTQSKHNHPV